MRVGVGAAGDVGQRLSAIGGEPVQVIVHHDERGAAFGAVGFARATGRAAAVVTTSGTAVANLLPGIVEASQAGLPLLVLSADRAPESRANGANQAIDQVNIFGKYTRFAVDLPCPTDELPVQYVLEQVYISPPKICHPHPYSVLYFHLLPRPLVNSFTSTHSPPSL